MKKLITLGSMLVAVGALVALLTPTPAVARPNCDTVRCLPCPDGYHLSLQWPNCCRCVKN